MEWRELDDFWDALLIVRAQSRVYHPPTNLYETDDEFVVMMAVSCVDRESLRVIYKSGALLIEGTRSEPDREIPKLYHLMEISFGAFQRRIIINAEIEPDGITSLYSDGMLVVRIPKARPRQITVEEGG